MNKNIITVFVSFILLILAGCGGGGSSGGTTQTPGGTNPTGAAMITIAGTLSSVAPAANLPVAVQDATGITDWTGATLTITNAKGELVATKTIGSDGNFQILVFANEQYFFRVTIGNLVLLYYLPPSTTDHVVEINPESTSTFMVLIQVTGLELGIPGVAVPNTPAELKTAVDAIDPESIGVMRENMSEDIATNYDPNDTQQNLGGAGFGVIQIAKIIWNAFAAGKKTYAVYVSVDGGGTVDKLGRNVVQEGEDLIITATPINCYFTSYVEVKVDANGPPSMTPDPPIIFTIPNINSATTVQYTFSLRTYEIDASTSAGAGGSIDPENTYASTPQFPGFRFTTSFVTVTCGVAQYFEIEPFAGYRTLDVLVDGISVGTPPTYTFPSDTDFTINHKIYATFERLPASFFSDTTDRFPSETQGNGDSGEISLDDAGKLISFSSDADNVVTPDTNGQRDIFIFDSFALTTTKVSVVAGSSSDPFSGVSGSQSSLISSDGRYTVFSSTDAAPAPIQTQTFATGIAVSNPTADTNNVSDIFIYDAQNDLTKRVSLPNHADQGVLGTEANKASYETAISGDARYVAFNSLANNLILGDTNNTVDVFLHDTQTGETKRVSVPNLANQSSLGSEGSGNSMWGVSLNGDGSKVVFHAFTTNLVVGDTNGEGDLFIHDTLTGETKRVSVPNLADQGTLGTEANGDSSKAMISTDGKFVVFESSASNLVVDDTNVFCDLFQNGVLKNCPDIFSYEIATGVVKRLSVDSNGTESNGTCRDPSISNDGLYVVFECGATNLVPGDTNNTCDNNFDDVLAENCFDIFVHNTQTGVTARVSVADDGSQGDGRSSGAAISGNGQYVGYESDATNLVPGDNNGFRDAFRTPNPLYVAPSP